MIGLPPRPPYYRRANSRLYYYQRGEIMECKYCHAFDTIENLYSDKYTQEFYHENCRPKLGKVERKPGKVERTRRSSRWSRGRVVNTGKSA